jgi:hypothetical protein
MRRTLLALLLGLPGVAFGLTEGEITLTSGAINIAQCAGAHNADLRLSSVEDLTLGFTWQVALGSNTFATGGTYEIYAAAHEILAGNGTTVSTDCTVLNDSGAGDPPQRVGTYSFTADGVSMSTQRDISAQQIAEAAGYGGSCAAASANRTIYLCVQWIDSSSGLSGFAKKTATLDLTVPEAPTNLAVTAGDGKLHVSCSGGSGDSFYQAKAEAAGHTTGFSSVNSSCSDLKISGLANGVGYTVTVYGLDSAYNPSAPSASETGTPVPTDDFWNRYKDAGGPDSGGCSSAAGAAGLLGALSLLALRRRKP